MTVLVGAAGATFLKENIPTVPKTTVIVAAQRESWALNWIGSPQGR